ncbi:MAG: aspartate-semialdehyde dehydrogenase [Candidatus Saccharicenans sp.]
MSRIIEAKEKNQENNLKKQESSSVTITIQNRKKLKAAVLGASGLVGQHFVKLLAEHPFFELSLMASSEKNAGKKFKELVWPELFSPSSSCHFSLSLPDFISEMTLQPANHSLPAKLKDENISLVFSALPSSVASSIEPHLRRQGLAVFTNASACRMLEEVPVIVPEVNQEHLSLINLQKEKYGGFIVAGSNCCVAGLTLTLKPLLSWGIEKVRVTTFQSISGAGFSGLRALEISNNLIPYIKDEEEKIARETAKILGFLYNKQVKNNSFPVLASCVRVPVKFGHLLNVEVEFQNVPAIEEIIQQMASFPGLAKHPLPSAPKQPLILLDEENRPQPAFDLWAGRPQTARGMAICLGRLRLVDNSLRYFALSNNLVRGAAGNCLLTAELALTLGYLN